MRACCARPARLAKSIAVGLAWATALSVAAALGGREGKAGAARAGARLDSALRDRRAARSGVKAGSWQLHPGDGGAVGLSLRADARPGLARRELEGLVLAIRTSGGAR